MGAYIVRRLLISIPVLFGITIIAFILAIAQLMNYSGMTASMAIASPSATKRCWR